jgi:hypothetical protein
MIIDLAAVLADDELIDRTHPNIRSIDKHPINPDHTAQLEQAIARLYGDGPLTGGAA